MDYSSLRLVHIATVLLSLALFLLRGFWMWHQSPRLQAQWVRIAPHLNDTLLLGAALAMLAVAQLNPLDQPWLLAKILGLLAYIVVGSIALKRGRSAATRRTAFLTALTLYAYIAAVAVTKHPIPGL